MRLSIKHLVIGICISLLGLYLSFQEFNKFPPILDTKDEVSAAFGGISLIKSGIPRAWSWLEEYGDFPIQKINGVDYRIVEPYFDDSPVFLLLTGFYALSQGMDSFEKVKVEILRIPMLYLFSVNIFLLFVLVYLSKGAIEASIAGLIYATVPTTVIGSRLPLDSNLLVTMSLLSLLLYVIYTIKHKLILIITTSLMVAISFLVKPTGIYIALTLIILSIAIKDKKSTVILTLLLLLAISLWFLYGAYYDWVLFLNLLSAYNAIHLVLPNQIIHLFDTAKISESIIGTDGWILWGWICVVIYIFLKKQVHNQLSYLILPVSVGSYLILFTIMSGMIYGWYRFPFYPFLAWASAAVILDMIRNPKFLPAFFFITIPVASSYIYGTGGNPWHKLQTTIFQYYLLLITIPILFYEILGYKKLKFFSQALLIILLVSAIVFNVTSIINFQEFFWNKSLYR